MEELPDKEIGLNLIPGYVVEVFKLQFLDLAGTCWLNSYLKQSTHMKGSSDSSFKTRLDWIVNNMIDDLSYHTSNIQLLQYQLTYAEL